MIHVPPGTTDATVTRYRCPTCDGQGGKMDRGGSGGRVYPHEWDWMPCPSCDGLGTVTAEQYDEIPWDMRAE